jgi:hypothetical protein
MGLLNYSYFALLLSFTGILLVSIYLMAIRRQKPIVEVLIILTGVAVICLLSFIWMLFKQPKPLFFFETALLAISIVCVVVLSVISYYYDDVFANNNDTSENDKFEKDLVNLSKNEFITEFKVNANQIKKIDSTKYTYAFSVFVKEDTFEKFPSEYSKRYLFYRKDDATSDGVSGHGTNFGIRLGADRGLRLDYSQQVNGVGPTTFNTALIQSNFPVNALTKIFVTVDKTLVNIYIDGIILTKQFKINNLKQPSLVKPIEFGNMPAYLANFSYLNHVIMPTSSIIEYLSRTNSINL